MTDPQDLKPVQTIARLTAGGAVRIVALGDSLTYGWMAERGYIDFLQAMLSERYPAADIGFINRGVPGDTAGGGLERLQAQVIAQQPDLVFIQFGLNDAFTGCPVGQFAAAVSRMIERLRRESAAEILLLTSVPLADPQENDLALTYYGELESIAAALRVPIVRVHAYWRNKTGGNFRDLLQADMVHPTAAGYRLMAEAIMQVLL